ncbi:hypothetical protein Mgra_00003962 [Meloidogyne graminicola]|uniref:Uncharacterized protein n=1 Tax=Meloidogyne graminicola TaxID=189291 RepID=A0A8S9ZTI9_9BILA|nr:hypothetical protein Mgra_00003962 [Meloidogyne graminicola]
MSNILEELGEHQPFSLLQQCKVGVDDQQQGLQQQQQHGRQQQQQGLQQQQQQGLQQQQQQGLQQQQQQVCGGQIDFEEISVKDFSFTNGQGGHFCNFSNLTF